MDKYDENEASAIDGDLMAQCTCDDVQSNSLSEAVANRCLHCCGKFLDEAKKWSLQLGPEPHIVTAIKQELANIVRLLLPIQRDMLDANGKRAADHAFLVDNPDMWAMFPDEIPHDVAEVLKRARGERCACVKKAENFVQAADQNCLMCCFDYRSEIGTLVDNWTALMKAAYRGNLDVVKMTVKKEVAIQNNEGATALMLAALKGRTEIVKYLIPYQAGMRVRDDLTATVAAALGYHPDCFNLLCANQAEREATHIPEIMWAAYRGDIQAAITHKDELYTKYAELTTLDFALFGNQKKIVRLLTSTDALRRFFAREALPKFGEDEMDALSFFSDHQLLLHSILAAICC